MENTKIISYVISNIAFGVRKETLAGRDYIVAKVTMIKPGIMDANKGSVLYSENELRKSPDRWNNIPIVVDHPVGTFSARSPSIINAQSIGVIFNARYQDGLVAEAWFDLARESIAPTIYQSLRAGTKIEVSTGLLSDLAPIPGVFNGVKYDSNSYNYRPDHLAILIGEEGACSIQDGCGVLNKTKTVGGEELPASAFAYVPDADEPSTWKLRIDSAAHVGGALAAIGAGFRGRKAKIPMRDLPAVKKKLRAAWLKFHKDKSVKDLPQIINIRETPMSMTDNQRSEIVDNLIQQPCCWEDEDRDMLVELPEAALTKLVSNSAAQLEAQLETELVANAARAGFEDAMGTKHTFDEKAKLWNSVKKEVKKDPFTAGMKKEAQTADEWMRNAPPEIRVAVTNASEIVEREKAALITSITADLSEEDRDVVSKVLNNQDLAPLRSLSVLAPKQSDDLVPLAPVMNYAGAAPASAADSGGSDDDFLPLPV